jgi:isocitrate dehydrogenase kinase/phosphatase
MAKESKLANIIYHQFLEYYSEFIELAEQAPALFAAGKLEDRLKDDLRRVQLYRTAVDKSVTCAQTRLGKDCYDTKRWNRMREQFKTKWRDELATTYFTSVMRKVFAQKGISIEFMDDGIDLRRVDPARIVFECPFKGHAHLGKAIQNILKGSIFSSFLSLKISQDTDTLVDIINEQLDDNVDLTSIEILRPAFFRGKGAYLVGQFRTQAQLIPIVFSVVHSPEGVGIDAVLVGYKATRSFLFSSTRSAFIVSTRNYRELYSFLQQLFPDETPGYILDLIGFTNPAKISLLQQLRKIQQIGEQFEYVGTGPLDLVFGIKGFPLVFKVIIGGSPERKGIIDNFRKVHEIDRLGQVLDSLVYRYLKLQRSQISEELIGKLEETKSEDIVVTHEYVILKRVYVSRRIIPVPEYIHTASKKEIRQILLRVGWNIKHLAAMGFLPRSLGLDHFGVTTWHRVVYLNNASLIDIRLFLFRDRQDTTHGIERYSADPADFEHDLNIPHEHKDMFCAVHGDLYLPHFWEDIKVEFSNDRHFDVFPYPTRYRLGTRRLHNTILAELHRLSDTVDEEQIRIVLDNLAVVDVELAGLSFLRLEVPHPSARVLVVEPIGPEIIAQLHRSFQDVTFDILQSESEIVESAGQWIPGIHGKLKTLVQIRKYDYVIGYVNELFDKDFFRLAKLKGFLLLSTGTHNIDIKAATSFHTVVTNAPGPTTTTVAEQNVGLMLDAIYSHTASCGYMPEVQLRSGCITDIPIPPLVVAQLIWSCLLQKTLKLDEMFSFGASLRYVRTGVGEHSTVYHEQIGQNKEAGIKRSIGVTGLNEVGIQIIELSIAHEISTIYVPESEYGCLPPDQKVRIIELISTIKESSQAEELSIEIVPVSTMALFRYATYTVNTDASNLSEYIKSRHRKHNHIDIQDISIHDVVRLNAAFTNKLTLGIQGLGRIGEAVARRAIVLGMNILVFQNDPTRPKYQSKRASLIQLADHRSRWAGQTLAIDYAGDKSDFFRGSNIITTLAPTTDRTRGWVDQQGLEQFATKATSPVRVIISAGKGLVDEDALNLFLRKNTDVEARLDVLINEHEGGAYLKLVCDDGLPLKNIKVTGHTAAAVREVRQLKIFKALENLRSLIDGKIPFNIVNNSNLNGKKEGLQSIVEIEGLKFFRMDIPSPRARVLVIEPLAPEIVLHLQQQFYDVSFDILLAESELVKEDGKWAPGINARLNAIVSGKQYDYCLGYCNANFDTTFFEQAQLSGLILFASAIHHIDCQAATQVGTIITNAPGFTTVAVTEQNIGMVLDALYGRYIQEYHSDGAVALDQLNVIGDKQARTVAQIMWFMLLSKALRLDAMYQFGAGDKYVRTGVRRDATVYHDQIGQYDEAGINNSIGIIGLDEIGINLIEFAMAYELSFIYILDEEYAHLSTQERSRLDELLEIMEEVSQTRSFSVRLIPVDMDELMSRATYTIKTPAAYRKRHLKELKTKSAIGVYADRVFVNDDSVFDRSSIGLTFGVQGLGRIGEAVVQRALIFGANVIVNQRSPERPKYQKKQERLRRLAQNRARVYDQEIGVEYVGKDKLFRHSNIVTTLAATTSTTRHWVDRAILDMLGSDAPGSVRIFVNAGKGLLNEADLTPYLRERPDVEVRLDVISDEQKGKVGQRFMDVDGRPLSNFKIAGHTAAAVLELRQLKICYALTNLRLHIDGQRPNNILNPEVVT